MSPTKSKLWKLQLPGNHYLPILMVFQPVPAQLSIPTETRGRPLYRFSELSVTLSSLILFPANSSVSAFSNFNGSLLNQKYPRFLLGFPLHVLWESAFRPKVRRIIGLILFVFLFQESSPVLTVVQCLNIISYICQVFRLFMQEEKSSTIQSCS